MSPPESAPTDGFVGRTGALDDLAGVLDSARAGHGRAVLLIGDAGVGKTRLAQHACALATDFLALTGACLPMSSLSVPLLPLRTAVSGQPAGERPDLRGVEGSQTAEVFDQWLEERCARGPVALVVDDLQWADPLTLDVLMWVLAGLPSRRLALLATVRRGELVAGHPLHRWLADVRRLPGFAELALGTLDLDETRAQVAQVVGDVPHERLVRDVFARTGGNAYLNRLLVRGLVPASTGLGPELPADLTSAVLRAWHRVSEPARELSRVLAVGGRVAHGEALERVAALAGVPDVRSAVRECVEADLLDEDHSGGYWFHHPLQAEALEESLAAPHRERLHAAFAASLEEELAAGRATASAPGAPELETLRLIADHHRRAGHLEQSLAWTLRAADRARSSGAGTAEVELVRRVLSLQQETGDPAPEGRRELWWRLLDSAASTGDVEVELEAVEALLADLDPAPGTQPPEDPPAVAALLVRSRLLRMLTGRSFLRVQELRRAVELTEDQPECWQHALALAELTHSCLWQDDPEAPGLASQALDSARASGDARALAYALAANAMLAVTESRFDDGQRLGRDAVAAAVAARDGFAFAHASLWEANAYDSPTSPRWRASVGRRRAEIVELALPAVYAAWLSASEAFAHLHAGDFETSRQLVRESLRSSPSTLVDVQGRLNAAWMATAQGRTSEAEGHLARADELFAESSTFLAFEFDAVRALVLLGGGHREEAVEAALAGTATPGVLPTLCEWLLPLAARAYADLAQEDRDGGRDPTDHLAALDDLTGRFPHILLDLGGMTPWYRRQTDGLEAVYQGEVARARQSSDAHLRWEEAASTLDGVLAWEACYSMWRLAESLLVAGPRRRDEGAEALRRAHTGARQLGAQPIVDAVESLARSTRVSLAGPVPADEVATGATAAGLTERETEVLGHIVAGRTYGEIARALVLSEKTVSSHVSHILAKTGCANRVDLARWATRPS
ncbi:AAA ATPase domain-containing protein [Pedococcus dokdonensis]|uniref:AAA ATPase domain-containing protein n=1 Tax=Pedococcus dokdonensis TaxID=443156 RepID=A0A1H0Q6G5_9MICO|nr:AAA family ATPase [Pedococcus dokdonensis]SDP12750.1 AAA ATPase domain-containing protein [Pedococcus dokdonensis]